MFAGNFAPRGWAFCDGQLLAVSQNDVLFSLLGTIYGGDGRSTFALPEMRGRVPLHKGTGPALSARRLGAKGGSEKETLTANELPSHTHPNNGSTDDGTSNDPTGLVLAGSTEFLYRTDKNTSLNQAAVASTGGSGDHTNLMPTLCINFIIALIGIYPSRS